MSHNGNQATVGLVLLLVFLFAVGFLPALALNVPTDPGGIGTSNLTAWFGAASEVYSDADCTVPATAGGTVACWGDQGPNNLEAKSSAVGETPTVQAGVINGLPVMRFDTAPNNDNLGTGSDSIDELETAFPSSDATVFIVQKASVVQRQSSFAAAPLDLDGSNRFGANVPWEGNVVNWDMGDSTGDGRVAHSPFEDIESFHMWGFKSEAGTGQAIYQNGVAVAADASADTYDPTDKELFIGAASTTEQHFSGDIAELIIYNTALSDMEQTHVELWLRDKYNLDLTSTAIFTAPVEFQNNVRGISQSAGVYDSDRGGTTAGMRAADFSFFQPDGDDTLVFGHNNAPFGVVTDGLESSAANSRWNRLWAIVVKDEGTTLGGWVDITFNIVDAGGSGEFQDVAGQYYLLKRETGSSSDFTEVPLHQVTVGKDEITFRVSVFDLGSEFTLGALDSPLAVGFRSLSVAPGISLAPVVAAVFALLALVSLFLLLRKANPS